RGPEQLCRQQGGADRPDQEPGQRVRRPGRDRQRGGPRLHRDRYDRRHARSRQAGGPGRGAGRPHRPPGGSGGGGRLPGGPRRGVHHRPGPVRGRRHGYVRAAGGTLHAAPRLRLVCRISGIENGKKIVRFSMEKRRVVITGLGTVNPTGNSVAESWAAVRRGECGVGTITQYDTSNSKVKLAAEVKDFDPAARIDKREARKMARFTQFAVAAAAEAIEDAGLDLEHADLTRCATVISSGIGGLPIMEEECLKGEAKGYDRVSPFFVPMTIANMAAGQDRKSTRLNSSHRSIS